MNYHNPVLLDQSIKGLNIRPNGIYVDATFGGGGHSNMILQRLSNGRLYAFDQDQDAVVNDINHHSFKLINTNFRHIKNFLKVEGITKIDGLLADLGVSSFQFNTLERGFSTRYQSTLDMRMNQEKNFSAVNVINDYSEEDLADVLYNYGELVNSRRIASEIVKFRSSKPILTTNDLINSISHLSSFQKQNKFLARVFQAVRIEVNDEISALKEMLQNAIHILKSKGRIVIISYHSLEDRIVKNLFKKGNVDGILEKDFYGNIKKDFQEINKNIIRPNADEIKLNPRSRSAKLRIAEKI